MNNKKLLMRLLCALLSIVMLACMLPAVTVSADDNTAGTETPSTPKGPTEITFDDEYYEKMTPYYNDGTYELACDEALCVVAYKNLKTGEIMYTNPWDMNKETAKPEGSTLSVREEMLSQIVLSYSGSKSGTLTSYTDAILKGQYSVTPIKNGVRVEYALGEISSRILVPLRIEENSFKEKIMKPLQANLSTRDFNTFMACFSLKKQGGVGIANTYPVTEKKGISIYVYNGKADVEIKRLRTIESWILAYCPDYSFSQMDEDYELVEFEQEISSPAVFRLALEYTIDSNGLSVSLPANGIRYDESNYRITELKVLPYMGASYKGNTDLKVGTNEPVDGDDIYSGYTFIPDGSGALYELTEQVERPARVYGEDYALFSVNPAHVSPMRMPVFGQVETKTNKVTGETESRGFVAIIEEGESFASIALNHSGEKKFASVVPSFIVRETDTSKSSWSVYASRRYTDDYRIRYIMLSDEEGARYGCSWVGMASAYRDYLDAKDNGFERLTQEDVSTSIPLYIETFGCMDTVQKVMSVPVTVSVPLTSFEDIETMYEYLLGEGVTNVNFKLTGYANGGLYADVPYKLKWESAVGGKSDFKDLLEYAAEHPEMGIFPDFDFVYTSTGATSVNMKKYGARTVDNRYTSKRAYSITQQTLVSYFQMVLSPATFSHFYEKLEKRYSKYNNGAISLSTLGSDLNSSFAEEDTSLREDSKQYTMQALSYFTTRNYEVMVDGGNAFTWSYADYILDVPLTSNRYNNEYAAVPFMGVVLHGYVQFAGSALNMEGNLTYAMLKAMESGAGVYFLLSYANTELLKSDELLSQNYSVRYDIWQARLVEIYKTLNSVLSDVQTQLIVDHQLLEGTRVPDADELIQDAKDEVEKEAAALAQREETIALALKTLEQIRTRMVGNASGAKSIKADFEASYNGLQALRTKNSDVMTAWDAYVQANAAVKGASENLTAANTALKASPKDEALKQAVETAKKALEAAKQALGATKQPLLLALTTYVAQPIAELKLMRTTIDALKAQAEEQYKALQDANADAAKLAQAQALCEEINAVHAEIVSKYGTATEGLAYDKKTDRDAFLYGQTYQNAAVEDLENLFAKALKGDLADADDSLDLLALIKTISDGLKVKTESDADSTNNTVTGNLDASTKYSVDNEIVQVTYGDYNEDGTVKKYKSLILNFNDYAVTTKVEVAPNVFVTYHIDAYGYAVIMHGANS